MQTRTRIAGSNFTVFTYMSQVLGFVDQVQDSGQKPITQYQAVTPLDAPYPVEIALPRVRAEGTLTLSVRELWNQYAWEVLSNLVNTYNIVDVFNAMSQTTTPISASTVINIPGGGTRGWIYNNLVVVDIDDTENISIGALTVPRNIVMVYTYKVPLANTAPGFTEIGGN